MSENIVSKSVFLSRTDFTVPAGSLAKSPYAACKNTTGPLIVIEAKGSKGSFKGMTDT